VAAAATSAGHPAAQANTHPLGLQMIEFGFGNLKQVDLGCLGSV